MVVVSRVKEQQEKLHRDLWKIVNDLRNSMQANEFRDYIFGLMMFRFLSEQLVDKANSLLINDNLTFEEALAIDELKEVLPKVLIEKIGYYIEPKYLFDSIVKIMNLQLEIYKMQLENLTILY